MTREPTRDLIPQMRLGRPSRNRVNVTAFAEKRKPDSDRRARASGNRVEQAVLSLGVLTRHGENGFEIQRVEKKDSRFHGLAGELTGPEILIVA